MSVSLYAQVHAPVHVQKRVSVPRSWHPGVLLQGIWLLTFRSQNSGSQVYAKVLFPIQPSLQTLFLFCLFGWCDCCLSIQCFSP